MKHSLLGLSLITALHMAVGAQTTAAPASDCTARQAALCSKTEVPATPNNDANDGPTYSIGLREDRPQFLPDSAKLVTPKNIQKLEAQAKANPKNVDLKFDLLMAYSKTSMLDKAWPVALQIDKLNPDYTLQVLKETEAQIKKDPKNQDARYRAAMAAFARSWQIKELARDKYMEPLKRGESIPDTWWEDFKEYIKTGDPDKAKSLNRPDVVAMLDQVRAQRSSAETQLQAVLKQDTKQTWAKNYLAFLNYDRGDLKQAEALIRESIASDPENPLSHFALGQLYLRQGQLKDAVAQMKVAFQLRAQGK